MRGEDVAFLIMLALAIAIFGFFAWERHRMCVAFIEGDLLRYHATSIRATFDWFDWDRDTFTYDVLWKDTEGKWHNGRCKVRSEEAGPFGEDVVYWLSGDPHRAGRTTIRPR